MAVLLYPEVAHSLAPLQLHPMAASFFGFLIIFLLAIIVGSIVGSLVRHAMKILKLGWFDRMMGACFGLLRGYLINVVIFLAFVAFPINSAAVAESSLKGIFLPGARILGTYVPSDFKQKLIDGLQYLQEEWLQHQPSETDQD
jgi:membrane protein required for colicin V production